MIAATRHRPGDPADEPRGPAGRWRADLDAAGRARRPTLRAAIASWLVDPLLGGLRDGLIAGRCALASAQHGTREALARGAVDLLLRALQR